MIDMEPTREFWIPHEPWMGAHLAPNARVSWLGPDIEYRATWRFLDLENTGWNLDHKVRIHPDDAPPQEGDPMTTTDRLNAAAKKLREHAGACDPWMGSEGVGSWSDEYATDSGNGSDAALIRIMHPGVALALADWLDAEATVQDSMQPMSELVSLAIEQAGGPAGYVRILHDDDDNPQMQADSSPAALRLADLILRGQA